MNKRLLKWIYRLPDPILTYFVHVYFNRKIKKHARLDVKGMENLECDFKRPYLFVGNHLSNSDGLLLNKVLEKENVIFVAGKKLKANSWTNLGFKIVKTIAISPNSADKEAIKTVINTVKAGNSIFVFPEGTRSRTAKMIEAKKGILLFAKLTKAPIVPVGIWGSEKYMPIREDMGQETFFDADVHIRVGKVFELPKKMAEETKSEWEARSLAQIMGSIAELLPEDYRGFYGNLE